MKGFGMKKLGEAGWMEKEKPTAGPYDAILRPIAVAPCTSDVHFVHGGSGKDTTRIIGHEAIGEIVEVGELVNNFKIGDKVVVSTTTPNWLAKNVQGKYNAHDEGPMKSFKFLGSKDGVFAEFFHVNQADANLAILPEGMSYESALMVVDMMSTGMHAIEKLEMQFGDTIVVLGIGPVGLMAVACARIQGAGRIIVVGTREKSVEVAKEYGATDIISYKEGDIVEQIRALVPEGVDGVVIAGGTADSFRQAVALCKPGGSVSNVNFFDVKDVLSMPAYTWGLGMSDVNIHGGFCPGGVYRMERLLNLVQYHRIDSSKLITHTFHGFEKIEDAYYLMESKPKDLIKPIVIIDWQ